MRVSAATTRPAAGTWFFTRSPTTRAAEGLETTTGAPIRPLDTGQGITGVTSGVATVIAPGSRIDFDPKMMQVQAVGSSTAWTTVKATATVTEDRDNGAFDYSCEK